MATKENENYLRAALLLYYGGSYVTERIIKDELDSKRITLETLLKKHKKALKRKYAYSAEVRGKLFPDPSECVDITQWDLSLVLSVISVILPNLNESMKKHLADIKRNRNYLAHFPRPSVRTDKYQDIIHDFKKDLASLAADLGGNAILAVQKYIEVYTKGPVDFDTKVNEARKRCPNDKLCQRLFEILNETATELEKILQKIRQLPYRQTLKVNAEAEITISSVNENKVNEIERKLCQAFNAERMDVISNMEDGIDEVVEQLIRTLRGIPDVEISHIQHNCVRIHFKCTSSTGLRDLLEFLSGKEYKKYLKRIEYALGRRFFHGLPNFVAVWSAIPQKCLNAIEVDLDEELERKCSFHCEDSPGRQPLRRTEDSLPQSSRAGLHLSSGLVRTHAYQPAPSFSVVAEPLQRYKPYKKGYESGFANDWKNKEILDDNFKLELKRDEKRREANTRASSCRIKAGVTSYSYQEDDYNFAGLKQSLDGCIIKDRYDEKSLRRAKQEIDFSRREKRLEHKRKMMMKDADFKNRLRLQGEKTKTIMRNQHEKWKLEREISHRSLLNSCLLA